MDQNLFRYCFGKPFRFLDPTGKKCTYFIFFSDYYHLGGLLRLPYIKPEFDECDKVAPVCCWIKDGKKYCREFYKESPTDRDPIIDNWPARDNDSLEKKDAYEFLIDLIASQIPASMRAACRKSRRCDCNGVFKLRNVCDQDMFDYLQRMVDKKMIPNNPCGKFFEWDCKLGQWINPDGIPDPNNPKNSQKE